MCVRIDGLVKARNLKKSMEKLNQVVSGLKEGKQEMSKHMQELDSSINAHILKIKVCVREKHLEQLKSLKPLQITCTVCVVIEHCNEPRGHRSRAPGSGHSLAGAARHHAEEETGGGGDGAPETHPGGDGEREEET